VCCLGPGRQDSATSNRNTAVLCKYIGPISIVKDLARYGGVKYVLSRPIWKHSMVFVLRGGIAYMALILIVPDGDIDQLDVIAEETLCSLQLTVVVIV